MPAREAVMVLDVGGSSLKSGLVMRGAGLEGYHETGYNSLADLDQLHDAFVQAIDRLWNLQPDVNIIGLGVSVPGPFDYQKGISYIRGQEKFEALYAQSLPDAWRQLAPYLTQIPIAFINDAHAFALGELSQVAAATFDRVLFVTLGTGCGSAFAEHGRLLTGGPGVPESGYIYNLPYGSVRLDDVLSSRGIADLWRAQGGQEEPVHEIAKLAYEGVARAKETFRSFGVHLANALAPTLHDFRPDALILGGKISKSFDLFAEAARQKLVVLEHPPKLLRAEHIDEAALLGAGQVEFSRTGDGI